jgi:RNA polymerase sigma factor (sigma-70 family)
MQTRGQLYKDFVAVIQENERLVHKVCSIYATEQEDRKDLFQEIILQAWLSFPKFKNASKVSTWLYRVALNTAINHKRREQKLPKTADYDGLYEISDTADPFDEEYKILQQLISELPTLEKALVILYLEDRSYQEIAEIMGISPSNVGTKLGRIKAKMKSKAELLTK